MISPRDPITCKACALNRACDVLQVWLDVAAHPSRGEEQAELIYRKVLRPVVEGSGR